MIHTKASYLPNTTSQRFRVATFIWSPNASGCFALLLFVVAFAFLLLSMQRDINFYDEGAVLVGAMRVADGEIPHRDFYSNYGPAQFYILAGLFKLFSPSVLVERLWDTLVRALAATFVFLIVAKSSTRREAYFAYGASLIWLAYFAFYGVPIFPAMLLALISSFFLLHVFKEKRSTWMLLTSGASVGLLCLFRYELGVVTFVSEGAVVSAFVLTQKNTIRQNFATIRCVLLPYGLAFAGVLLPFAITYLVFAPLSDLFDVINFSSHYYVKMRRLPFPTWQELAQSRDKIAIYLPIVVWAGALVVLLREKASRPTVECAQVGSQRWAAIMFSALSMVYYLKGFVRVSVSHMALSIIPALALLAIIAKHRSNSDRTKRAVIWLCIFVAALPTWTAAQIISVRTGQNIDALLHATMWKVLTEEEQAEVGSCRVPTSLERIACFKLDKNRIEAVKFLQDNTKNSEVIFSGLPRHDKIFVNDEILYFAAKRRPATKWNHFNPGIQTTAVIQNRMVLEFESEKPRFVVLESDWDNVREPNESAISSGVVALDVYIRDHYVLAASFGSISILARKANMPP